MTGKGGRSRVVALVSSVLCMLFASSFVRADTIALYQVELSANLKYMTVNVTLTDGSAIASLHPLSSDAWDRLDRGKLVGLADDAGNLALLPGASQHRYSTKVSGGLRALLLGALFSGESPLLTDIRDWFWVPSQWHEGDTVELEFQLPSGISISAPWQMATSEPGEARFIAKPAMLNNEGTLAIGKMQHEQLEVADAKLQIAISVASTPKTNDRYVAWIETVATAVVHEFGKMPVSPIQVLVVPTWFGSDKVPTGQVRRGGGSGIMLIPKTGIAVSELVGDWTLYHEFVHFFHPYLGSDGRWIAEGVASYYQNILLAKSGQITRSRAWQRLASGFARGNRETRNGETVKGADLSMRTYWAGAVMALDIDIQLRRNFDTTLSMVLAEFSNRYLPSKVPWAPRDFMLELDKVCDTSLFIDAFDAYSTELDFPDYAAILKDAGLDLVDGEIRFETSSLRDRIILGNEEDFHQCTVQ